MDVLVISVAALGLWKWWNHTPPLKPGEKSLTFYYMRTCPHCHHMFPDMRRLGSRYKNIAIRWVEERNNYEFDVNAFPTLIYRDAAGAIEKYDGSRNYSAIRAFLDAK